MSLTRAYFWKSAPFIRLLPSLIIGILWQWYYPVAVMNIGWFMAILIAAFGGTFLLGGFYYYKIKWLQGVCIMLLVTTMGMLLTHYKNIEKQVQWFGQNYKEGDALLVVLRESFIEKANTFKAVAEVNALVKGEELQSSSGSIILYFKKDSVLSGQLDAGSIIKISKQVEPIRNSGNPGAFDYRRYCGFQGITHQVFLQRGDFVATGLIEQNAWRAGLQYCHKAVLSILRTNIQGKKELGIAEALLIGYREDIDRETVQEYANTSVIHVIAISGMHLAMIYGLLLLLLKPLDSGRRRFIHGIIILLVLWGFSILTGAGASILRAAVMFSFIVVGQHLSRPVSVYHSLAASAFFLLCYNPFLLWDVGFQLSYAAVLSIVIFLKPITNCFYSSNKVVYNTWKLVAVTIAAQVLTTPLSMYHFQQMPNLFLLSNLFIVPLSGIILYGEILLCTMAFIPSLALLLGKLLSWLLLVMNEYNGWLNALPFAVTNGIHLTVFQVLLLYTFTITVSIWLMQKIPRLLPWSLVVLWVYLGVTVVKHYQLSGRTGMIVYNIPRQKAIDFYGCKRYYFIGDSSLLEDGFLKNFHLRPARTSLGLQPADTLPGWWRRGAYIYWGNKRIVLLQSLPQFENGALPVETDIVVLSGSVKSTVSQVQQFFRAGQYVFDGSCSQRQMLRWKNECDSLHLRRHSVAEDGAFELDL